MVFHPVNLAGDFVSLINYLFIFRELNGKGRKKVCHQVNSQKKAMHMSKYNSIFSSENKISTIEPSNQTTSFLENTDEGIIYTIRGLKSIIAPSKIKMTLTCLLLYNSASSDSVYISNSSYLQGYSWLLSIS